MIEISQRKMGRETDGQRHRDVASIPLVPALQLARKIRRFTYLFRGFTHDCLAASQQPVAWQSIMVGIL